MFVFRVRLYDNKTLQKISDPDHGHAWVRCKTGKSKNYQNDSEDLRKGGLIPYGKNKHGFDAGLFIEDYQKPRKQKYVSKAKVWKSFYKKPSQKEEGAGGLLLQNKNWSHLCW